MDCKPTKLRPRQRMSAVCVTLLLLAANDLGYSSPVPGQYPVERVLCINSSTTSSATQYPKIQFTKGRFRYQSDTGVHQLSNRNPSDGDTLVTGSDGFVSVMLSEHHTANIQPYTVTKFDSSPACMQTKSTSGIENHDSAPFLSAAVRG